MIISLLIICCFIGFFFPIAAGVTLSDIASIILLVICLSKVARGKWVVDAFGKYSLVYASIMLLSALINLTLSETQFLNYFRLFLFGTIIYISTYNIVLEKFSVNLLVRMFSLFSIYFIFYSKKHVFTAWNVGFTNLDIFDNSMNLNTWGFTNLMFVILLYLYYKKNLMSQYILFVLISIHSVFVYLSYSRSSYLLYILFWGVIITRQIRRGNIKSFIKYVIIGGILVSLCAFYILPQYLSSDLLEIGTEFITKKMNSANSDLEEVRWVALNEMPINNFLINASFIDHLLGDGVSIQHSWFSHVLISTGIVGFAYFIIYHLLILRICYKQKCLILAVVVVVMLANDFATNIRFIFSPPSYLYMFICAFLMADKKYDDQYAET